jgi:hypothetical protein
MKFLLPNSKKSSRLLHKTLIMLLLFPWMIGCQRTLVRHDENWIEGMGGSGKMTQTIYYIPPGPNCGPEAIGRYDAQFADAGVRLGHYSGNSGIVIEGGAGYVTTLSESQARWYNDTVRTPNVGVKNTFYGFLDAGYDADYFGWRFGVFLSDSLHYQSQLVLPTVRLRLGALEEIHAEMGMMRNPTFLSSGSIADAGVVFPLKEFQSKLYLGLGASSGYAAGQILGQVEIQATNDIFIKASGNYGILNSGKRTDDPSEYGFGLGIKYKW